MSTAQSEGRRVIISIKKTILLLQSLFELRFIWSESIIDSVGQLGLACQNYNYHSTQSVEPDK